MTTSPRRRRRNLVRGRRWSGFSAVTAAKTSPMLRCVECGLRTDEVVPKGGGLTSPSSQTARRTLRCSVRVAQFVSSATRNVIKRPSRSRPTARSASTDGSPRVVVSARGAPRGSSATYCSTASTLSTITKRSVVATRRSISGVSCPGTRTKRSSCCRTSSYSARVIRTWSSHIAALHSQTNSNSWSLSAQFATACSSSPAIRSFTSRRSASLTACRAARLPTCGE